MSQLANLQPLSTNVKSLFCKEGEIVKKSWGDTRLIYQSEKRFVTYNRFHSGFSSHHSHKHLDNIFYVLRGTIVVKVEGEKRKLLEQGESLRVPRGLWHDFVVARQGEMLEIYESEYKHDFTILANDIVRSSDIHPDTKNPYIGNNDVS